MDIGKRLKEVRIEKGLSQDGLSDVTGLSKKTIGRWERGETVPSTADLTFLLGKINVSYSDFFGESADAADIAGAGNGTAREKALLSDATGEAKEAAEGKKKKAPIVKLTQGQKTLFICLFVLAAVLVALSIGIFCLNEYFLYLQALKNPLYLKSDHVNWFGIFLLAGSVVTITFLIWLFVKRDGKRGRR